MSGEGRMVRGGTLATIVVLPLAALLALVFRGTPGALAAAIAIALVLANFAVAGLALVWVARRAPVMFPAVAMPSYAVRMIGVFLAMKFLRGTDAIDHPTFAVTFGAGIVALLAYECWLYTKTPWLALTFSPKKETP
ncbi:MAG: hypothetical protein ABR548_13935 [Actinomycetota bacterium]|nr:hypothetical protein [Actinomycetota bacterium]